MDVIVPIAGIVIATVAVVVAWVQLRRLRAERQRNFYLTQLVDLADALAEFGGVAPHRVDVRVRVLPPDMVPVARAWVTEGDRAPSRLFARYEAERAAGEDWGTWVRERVREEVNGAVALLLATHGRLR
ncbi:hypothetical protein OG905_11205 [Streptomyces sp. NBC_00322]|uniref:hypothetical protein n=1 Tax=Streptomyces sp. NBC_00322 TaxID=2975712 RepID=UPI002E2CE495|nr:hypothetical protein [Streptomyces sp. NBC_00322]